MEDVINDLKNKNIGEIKENVSFKTLTTYKTGGIAKYLIIPSSIDNLIYLTKVLKANNISFKIWGNGSNILVSDNIYNGVIIKLSNLNKLEINDTIVKVESGYSLLLLANTLSKQGLSGLEWACGIPGTIGGAIYMNAGAYLKSMKDIVLDVTVLDQNYNIKNLSNEDLEYSYRKSMLMEKNYIVLSTTLKLEKKDKDEILKVVEDRKTRRISSQPLEYPSAGSVFRNPDGDYAGRLIEECGLKGKVIGGAKISDKHANFIVNYDNATSTDIKNLMDLAKTEVKNKFNIDLKIEQELFNWE